jgi:hypothetical protein
LHIRQELVKIELAIFLAAAIIVYVYHAFTMKDAFSLVPSARLGAPSPKFK